MRSEQIKELATALIKAQSEFPSIKKGKTAEIESKRTGQTYKYSYADLGDIIDAIGKTLKSNGLGITQSPSIVDGAAALNPTLFHESGQWISEQMLVYVSGEGAQGQGSAITYARRYALTAILGIVTESDDDGAAGSKSPPNAAVDAQTGEIDLRIETILKAAQGADNPFLKDIAQKYQQYGKLSEKQIATAFKTATGTISTPRSAPRSDPFDETLDDPNPKDY